MNKRDSILTAAAEEFAAKGYAGTSFGSIAARVNMHRNALQHYIASKPGLAAEIAWRPFKNGQFLSPDAGPVTGGLPAIRQLVSYVAQQYVADVFARASMRLMDETSSVPADLPVPFHGWVEPIHALLNEAVGTGDIRPETDTLDLAWRMVSAFAGARLMAEVLDELDTLEERILRTIDDLIAAHRIVSPGATDYRA